MSAAMRSRNGVLAVYAVVPWQKPISQPNHLSSGISKATHRRHLLHIHRSRPFAGPESRHLPTICCHCARLADTF
ncbi:hypothetical protein PLUA15_120083 [Pseudomonas lundensis]|uniref:Uncharacterized protein n=1 Tax=Pseudomonas lundensis TaxID=86185 RepID=A0AAX2H235_9PSED|nr:hypothetical protein PLUA15_120083 [Pseudomonas lundensis]